VYTFLIVGGAQSEAGAQQALMEASLSVEVAMIVLDAVTLYVNSFKVIFLFKIQVVLFQLIAIAR